MVSLSLCRATTILLTAIIIAGITVFIVTFCLRKESTSNARYLNISDKDLARLNTVDAKGNNYTCIDQSGALTDTCDFYAYKSCGSKRRSIALTFDDGPAVKPSTTSRLLQELDHVGIKATFFSSPGAADEQFMDRKCSLVRRMVKEGHQVEVHTWHHPKLINNGKPISYQELYTELRRTYNWLKKCGANPKQFRPPYGILSARQANFISYGMGLVVAMWNVAPQDASAKLSTNEIVRRIKSEFHKNVGNGNSAVILMHDTEYDDHLNSVKAIVEYFRSHQYSFVTGDSCYNDCGNQVCRGTGSPRLWKDVFQF